MKNVNAIFFGMTVMATAPWFSLLAAPDEGAHWPQWRGPNGDGTAAAHSDPPVEWSEDRNIKWKLPIPGDGSGTPIVWGNKLFVQTAVKAGASADAARGNGAETILVAQANGDDPRPEFRRRGRPGGGRSGPGGGGGAATEAHQFILLCIDRSKGEILWQRVAAEEKPHEGHHGSHAFGSHSPVTDGEHVYAFFGSRGLFCYDMEGNLKWKRDLGDMTMRSTFGEGNSAAIHGNTLVVPWDHEGPSAIYALDKKTGETMWKTDRDEDSTWASPLIIEHGGKVQVVTNGHTAVRSYDLASGDLLWQSGGQTERPVSTPVTDGTNVYVGSGFRGSYLEAIKLGASGEVAGTEAIVWSVDRNTPDVPSLLLSGKRLYYLSQKSGIVTCCDAATGKVHFGPERLPGLSVVYSSPVAANGNVYLTGREGMTIVFKDADEFEIVATNKLDDGIDGSPVVVGNEIYLRGKHYLYCIAEA